MSTGIASLAQVRAQGLEVTYLCGQPEVSYFKRGYKTHSRFAKEIFHIQRDNTGRFSIPRQADLYTSIQLVLEFPCYIFPGYPRGLQGRDNDLCLILSLVKPFLYGNETHSIFNFVNSINFQDGDMIMESLNREQLEFLVKSRKDYEPDPRHTGVKLGNKIHFAVNIPFWFSRDYSLAFPLIATQYSTQYINFDGVGDPSFKVEYVFLEDAERNLFAQTRNEYLIPLQKTSPAWGYHRRLEFSGSIRFMYFKAIDVEGDYVILKFGNQIRQKFDKYQLIYGNWSGMKRVPGWCVIPFALNPHDINPSGHFNSTMVSDVFLEGVKEGATIYAEGYNILCVQSGFVALKYSYE